MLFIHVKGGAGGEGGDGGKDGVAARKVFEDKRQREHCCSRIRTIINN